MYGVGFLYRVFILCSRCRYRGVSLLCLVFDVFVRLVIWWWGRRCILSGYWVVNGMKVV